MSNAFNGLSELARERLAAMRPHAQPLLCRGCHRRLGTGKGTPPMVKLRPGVYAHAGGCQIMAAAGATSAKELV